MLAAEALLHLGDPERAAARVRDAQDCRAGSCDQLRASLLRSESLLAMGLAGEARELVSHELKRMRPAYRLADRVDLLRLRAAAEEELGRPRQARRALGDAVALAAVSGREGQLAATLAAMAGFNRRSGMLQAARENLREAESAARRSESHRLGAAIELERIRLLVACGRIDAALAAAPCPLPRNSVAAACAEAVEIEIARAECLTSCGKARDAAAALQELLELLSGHRRRQRVLVLIAAGDAQAAIGDLDRARLRYLEAEDEGRGYAGASGAAESIHRKLGELLLRQGDHRGSVARLRKAAAVAARRGWARARGLSLVTMAAADGARGMQEKACRSLREAARSFAAAEAPADRASALLAEARVWRRRHLQRRSLIQDGGVSLQPDGIDDLDADRDELQSAWCALFSARDLYRRQADGDGEAECAALAAKLRTDRGNGPYGAPNVAAGRIRDRGGNEPRIVAESPAMARALAVIDMVAATGDPVLIVGETGTGKELAARRIHGQSARGEGSFVAVNCSAVPDSMFEREFYGHRRGAFTGADQSSPGYCQRADGGTLFLDEIGDMSPSLQAKLLRLLQEGTFQMLGDPSERKVDLRVVAATNADLGARMKDGRFRKDLYYRLQVLTVELPPLRERREDLDPLLRVFIRSSLQLDAAPADLFTADALRALRNYPWPGNIRELEGVARRMAILAGRCGRATLAMLPDHIARWSEKPATASGAMDLGRHLDAAERGRIEHALLLCEGNRSRASRLLGISRNTLYKKMDRHGLA